ncbi:YncE family protein [uncultured Jatrophihabitans sp.]|uniref:YncE family protein n=1 Tax=uncultured Jatrophihabitans sp. TaxID=1610747 RepID=UPI0035CBF53E
MSPRRARRLLAWLTVAGVALAACSSGSDRPGAAEPATAPRTTAAADGSVRTVGAAPEGIVYAPRAGLVAVAVRKPDRLLLLDPDSLAVRRSVPLPGDVRHLQVSVTGDEVLVPAESARKIVEVPLPTGAIRATTVGKQPHDAARAADGDVVVGNEFGRSISVLRNGRVLRTIRDLTQPGGVVAAGDTVAVVDVGAFTVSTYDLATLTRRGRIDAGKGPTHGVLVRPNTVLVSDTRGDALLLDRLSPLKQVGRLSLPGTPYGLAVDATTGTVWVTLTARNEVVGVRVVGDRMSVIARYPTVRQPNTVAVDPGSHRVWVTGTDAGVVQLIRR